MVLVGSHEVGSAVVVVSSEGGRAIGFLVEAELGYSVVGILD